MAKAKKRTLSGRAVGGLRTARRPLVATVVFALVVSTLLVIWPATNAEAANGTYYLKGTGVPKAHLSTAAPTSDSLPNYDPGQDSDPGRKLDKSDEGWNEGDGGKYQLWVAPNGALAIDGQVTLTFWSAMKDFEDDKGGRVEAFLLDCNPGGNSCVLIDQGSRESDPWSGSGSWVSNTIDFGSVTYSIADNRSLAIKVVVGDDSDDDMWFAYDTTSYPSRLSLQTVAATTTTTSTTSATVAPTTTVPATTTSTRPPVGPTTPPPPGPTTTVAPIVETTSTTTPETDGSSTTLAIAAPSDPGPGSSNDSSPVGGSPGAALPDGPVALIDAEFGDVEDPVLTAVGAPDEALASSVGNWTGSIIKGLELVIPPWAAAIVASPLMILGFVIEAMTDSGKAIVLPMALLMAGMLWVVLENRVFTFALIRRAEDEEG